MNHMPVFIIGIISFLFLVLAFNVSRKNKTVHDYFHVFGTGKLGISWLASTMTLGTGLVYYIAGVNDIGFWWILIPFSVAIGYYALAYFQSILDTRFIDNTNVIYGMNKTLNDIHKNQSSLFLKGISSFLVFIYIIFLAIELYASGQLIAPFIFNQPDNITVSYLTLIIFALAAVYAVISGIRGVVMTDKIQIIFILLLFALLFFVQKPATVSVASTPFHMIKDVDLNSFALLINACILAMAVQFLNIINWTYCSHVSDKIERKKTLNFVGTGYLVIFGSLTFLLVYQKMKFGDIHTSSYFNGLHQFVYSLPDELSLMVLFFVLGGMISLLFSTVDSLILSLIQIFYNNILGKDSKNKRKNPTELRRIKWISLFSLLLTFLFLIIFNYQQPMLLTLISLCASGMFVLVPLIILMGILGKEDLNRLHVITKPVILGYFALTILALGMAILLFFKIPSFVPYVSLLSLGISSLFSYILYKKESRVHIVALV